MWDEGSQLVSLKVLFWFEILATGMEVFQSCWQTKKLGWTVCQRLVTFFE
jgi:hypothetical protein